MAHIGVVETYDVLSSDIVVCQDEVKCDLPPVTYAGCSVGLIEPYTLHEIWQGSRGPENVVYEGALQRRWPSFVQCAHDA